MREIKRITVNSKEGLEKIELLKKRKEKSIEDLRKRYANGEFDKYF